LTSGDTPKTQIKYASSTHLYSVAVIGFRVNYAADYEATQNSNLPDGAQLVNLNKVSDNSTYSNMPEQLELKVKQDSTTLAGLSIFASPGIVVFGESDCKTNSEVSSGSFHCPVGTELVCGNGSCVCSRY
jgi:hypothetical protein